MEGPKFASHDLQADLLSLVGSGDLCSKRWIWQQYDYSVRTNTIAGPGGDAAIVRIKEAGQSVAMSLDGNARYCALSPKEGARPMGLAMALGIATQILGAFILSWLLSKTVGLTYRQKVLFAAVFGLGVGILGHVPYFVWWHFPAFYTAVSIADMIISWALAGLVIGKVL